MKKTLFLEQNKTKINVKYESYDILKYVVFKRFKRYKNISHYLLILSLTLSGRWPWWWWWRCLLRWWWWWWLSLRVEWKNEFWKWLLRDCHFFKNHCKSQEFVVIIILSSKITDFKAILRISLDNFIWIIDHNSSLEIESQWTQILEQRLSIEGALRSTVYFLYYVLWVNNSYDFFGVFLRRGSEDVDIEKLSWELQELL